MAETGKNKTWWGVERACTVLGVTRSTLLTMVDRRQLTHYRVGPKSRIVFRPADIQAYLDSVRVEATPPIDAQQETES
jgi:excisionase family DNA binding protein